MIHIASTILQAVTEGCAVYLLAKQHMIPDRPRNQQHPMNLMMESNAVAHNKA